MRRRLAGHPALVVGAIVLFAAAIAAWFTTRMTQFEPDEIGYTKLAIQIGDLMQPISTTPLGRDRLNQLYPLTIAPFYKLFANATAYEIAHVWNALLMASSAIPAYLLGREVLRGRRAWSYLFALLVAIAPWLTLSAVQLTEVAAYPASVWALWAMQRALARPSLGRDAVAFALIGLASFGRLQLILLAPVYVVAVLVHELAYDGMRDGLRRLLQGHKLIVAGAALGIFVVLPLLVTGVLVKIFGFYGNTLEANRFPPGIWDLARTNFVFMALGIGALPAAMAIGLVVDALLPGERRKDLHAYAILMALIVVGLIVQVASINVNFNGSVVQERYTMFIAPPLLLGGLALLVAGRRPALMTALGAIPLVALIATTDYQTARDSFWYLVSPSLTTFYDVIAPRLARLAGNTDASRTLLLAVVVAAGSAVFALALRRERSRRVAGVVLGVGLVVFSLAVTIHAFDKIINGTPASAGLGSGSKAGADWIDRALPDGTGAALLAEQLGQTADARGHWWATEFWNRDVNSAFVLGGPPFTYAAGAAAKLDPATGRISSALATPYVVSAERGVPLSPDGKIIARSPDGAIVMRRIDGALRARWGLVGASDDGWLPAGHAATLHVYRDGGPCRRLVLTVSSPAGIPAPRHLSVHGPGVDRTMLVNPGEPRAMRMNSCAGAYRLGVVMGADDPSPSLTLQVAGIEPQA